MNDRFSVRRGTYRVIYRIDDKARVVTMIDVAHRRDVYRTHTLMVIFDLDGVGGATGDQRASMFAAGNTGPLGQAELPLYKTNPDDFAGLGHLVTVIPVTRPEVPNERQASR